MSSDAVACADRSEYTASEFHPDAFERRSTLMPMWGGAPVAEEARAAVWQTMLATPLPEGALAYLDIPFCANHCVFCPFYRNAWNDAQGGRYVERLIAEVEAEAAARPRGGSVAALYLGGGTPSALAAADLARLLRVAGQALPLAADCEITVEGRMLDFGRDKVEACLCAGANRLSIGVQTFDTRLRRRLGRRHGGDEVAAYLRELAATVDAVLVADLIFGLPGQDDACWANDLDIALSLGLSGIDVYAFNCFPSLPIHRMIARGALPRMSTLAEQARQYALAVRRLRAGGWTQLSNSHFAAPGSRERNRYNREIKSGADCAAFGAGAGGCLAGYSYSVEGDLERYLGSADKPLAALSRLGAHQRALMRIQGEMEAGRLALAGLPAAAHEAVERWRAIDLLEVENTGGGDIARLSVAGRFWAPTMTREIAQLITAEEIP